MRQHKLRALYHTNIPHHTPYTYPLALVIHYCYLFVALVRRSWERKGGRRKVETFSGLTRSAGRDKADENGHTRGHGRVCLNAL